MQSTWSLPSFYMDKLLPWHHLYRSTKLYKVTQQQLTKTALALQQGLWVPPGTALTGRNWVQSICFTGTSLTLCLRNCFLKGENFLSSCLLGYWNSNSCLILWKWGDGAHRHGGVLAVGCEGSYLHLQEGQGFKTRFLASLHWRSWRQHHFSKQLVWKRLWGNKLFDCIE